MGVEDFAWKAFLLNGSIQAYLLYRSALDMRRIDDGEDEGFDNKTV